MNKFSELSFENLVYKLLVNLNQKSGTVTKCDHTTKNGLRVDILIEKFSKRGLTRTAVEIKYYRPFSKPSASVVERAVYQLKRYIEYSGVTYGLLIIPCETYTYSLRDFISNFNIEVWDLNKLLDEARTYPEILWEITKFLELDTSYLISENIITYSKNIGIGKELINKFESIQPGREHASRFESWCIDVLKYLYGEYLVGWHEQSETIDGLNRRDLVCRIKSETQTEIWNLILHTLRSRYIVFEFKNYTEKISQREIITTERYLYPTALRTCAIILSREGASNNANLIIQGAMREHGKLIISLSYKDIHTMLERKDKGEDPNVYLFDKVDEFLIGLGR